MQQVTSITTQWGQRFINVDGEPRIEPTHGSKALGVNESTSE